MAYTYRWPAVNMSERMVALSVTGWSVKLRGSQPWPMRHVSALRNVFGTFGQLSAKTGLMMASAAGLSGVFTKDFSRGSN